LMARINHSVPTASRFDLRFDIHLRVNAEESHGTAPLDCDITVCSLPLVPAVGIRWTSHIGGLRAVPTSRYSYLLHRRQDSELQ